MVSTLTGSVISAITDAALTRSLGLIAIVALVVFLLLKLVVIGNQSPRSQALGRALNIAILPLLLVFLLLILTRLAATVGV